MAGTTASTGGRRAPIVGINITPMVDVVLVLLVIMMVSATYIASQSIKVDLPKAGNAEGGSTSLAIVTIEANGSLRWNDAPVDEAGLLEEMKKVYAQDPETNLVITADKAASHGAVVRAMDLAKGIGIVHFAIGVEQSG